MGDITDPDSHYVSHFNRKTKDEKRKYIQQPWVYPMASQNLAAIVIQSTIRGHLCRRFLFDPDYDPDEFTPFDWATLKSHYFSVHWIAAMQIQFTWRQYKERYKPIQDPYNDAICMIQRVWRSFSDKRIYKYYKHLVQFQNMGDPKLLLKSINPSEAHLFETAANIHVRFRLGGGCGKFPPNIYYKIFTHGPLCDVGAFAPLDYVKRRQMQQLDFETRIHNVSKQKGTIRLSGNKTVEVVYSQQSEKELDKGAKEWYTRTENNGWRSVIPMYLEEAMSDPIVKESHQKTKRFHFSKLQRKQDIEKKKKKKRIEWLRKLYTSGLAKERHSEEKEGKYNLDDESKSSMLSGALETLDHEEKEAEALLEWSESLDYDEYLKDWNSTGIAAIRKDEDIEYKFEIH